MLSFAVIAIICGVYATCAQPSGGSGGGGFPAGFRFGAASSAYQVEGAWNHSDKGESIWDRLCHTWPEVAAAGTGDVACDSYTHYKTDVRLARDLGLHFYRFSISWPRLLPTGLPHQVSEEGAQYYNRLIDELLQHNIQPVITIYHFDLPQRLQDLGGWVNPLIQQWFVDYARVVFSLYADRVKTWLTINEPVAVCDFTYDAGVMAPRVRDPDVAPHLCAKNVLMAHAAAYRLYDEEFRHKYHGEVSLVNNMVWFEPASPEDEEVAELANQLCLGRYSQAVYGAGGWPADVERLLADTSAREGHPRSRLPPFTTHETQFIKGTFDFYALNYYTARCVRRSSCRPPCEPLPGAVGWPASPGRELPASYERHADWPTPNRWMEVYPEGLRKALNWIKRNYGEMGIMITEIGYPGRGGRDDTDTVRFHRDHLRQVMLAIKEDGVNVSGYTVWALTDNYEWLDGYNTKFGLYEVDFTAPSRPRSPRRSARYYASVIKHHSLHIPHNYEKDEL